mmetsp:Transcript_29153/g.84294  ORF Transcript_29153/g.84294 Transcript_29153/m.84294 type:complete len:228 (-) Transcript_29153:1100-1783(-)
MQEEGVGGGECVVTDGCGVGLVVPVVGDGGGRLDEMGQHLLHVRLGGTGKDLDVDPAATKVDDGLGQGRWIRYCVPQCHSAPQPLHFVSIVTNRQDVESEAAKLSTNTPGHQRLTQPVGVLGTPQVEVEDVKGTERPPGGQLTHRTGDHRSAIITTNQHLQPLAAVGQPCLHTIAAGEQSIVVAECLDIRRLPVAAHASGRTLVGYVLDGRECGEADGSGGGWRQIR